MVFKKFDARKLHMYMLLIARAVKTTREITINFKDLHVRYQKSKRRRERRLR